MTEQTLTRPVQDYVPPAPRAPQAERRQPTRVRPDRLRYLWLAAGTALSLLAMGGRWDIPLAGWLFPILLLMFIRGSARTFAGVAWVWLASTVATMFWIAESGLPLLGVPALGGIGLSTLLTVPFLLDRVIATRLATRHPLLSSLVFPTSRVAVEFLIATVSPFGAVFGMLAVTQYTNLPLLQLASVTGAYGISFLIAWLAPVACLVWQRRSAWRSARTPAVVYLVVLAAVLIGGGARLAFAVPAAGTVRVAGISPSLASSDTRQRMLAGISSIPAVQRTDPDRIRPALAVVDEDLLDATRREAAAGARIVVWPEAGARILAQDEPAWLARVRTVARQQNVYIDMGLGIYNPKAPYTRNVSVLIDPSGQVRWTYDKAHPIPGMENYPAGKGPVPVTATPFGRLTGVICYDADFPTLMRRPAGRADIMLVPANDWPRFGAPHTRDAAIRAVENGYSLVRQDSQGVATTFDYQGHVLASTDYYRTGQQTMIAAVPTQGTHTVYAGIGDLFAWLCVATAMGLCLVGVMLRRR